MKAMTRNMAIALTCLACTSTAAAQPPRDVEGPVRNLQQQARKAEEKAQAAARQRTARRGGQAEVTESFFRTVRLVSGGTFDLQNVAGDVEITGGGGEARIEAVKRVRALPDARARTLLNAIRIDVAERGGNVEVRTLHPRAGGQAVVDYTVRLPENVNIILRSATGNLRVQNMSGDELTANTLSGNVVIRDSRSRMLDLHTVGGNMLLHDIAAQRAMLQSMQGNLEYAGRLSPTGRYQFQTHRGDIRVIPSGDPGFDLDAMTFRGNLQSDFTLTLPRNLAATRQQVQRILRGTVGDAGAVLTARSFDGNIVIVKR